jgi:hypothetical protein
MKGGATMRWKMYSSIALATLAVATVPSLTVNAEEPIEYALILAVVGVGPDEAAEVYWVPQANRGTSQAADGGDRLFKHDYSFTIPAINASNPACTQTFKVSVEPNAGINVLHISKIAEDLLVNGTFVGVFDGCFAGATRVIYQVGIPVPPGMIQQATPDTNSLALTLKDVRITGYSIVGLDGGTRAAVLFSGLEAGDYTLRVGGILN